jgi:sugar phosphate isomerase/epimerase
MADIPVGLQLYSVREDCAKDLEDTLKAVAEMGYVGVEFAGYHGHSAEDIRKMLDALNLTMCGTHTGADTLLSDRLDETIEFSKVCGNRFLIIPWYDPGSKEGWLEFAAKLNDVADKVGEHGMHTGYHNHAHDFEALDGTTPWDLLFGNTSDQVVMQLDTGNAFHGGANPVPYIKRYPGRALTVHLKEFSKTNHRAVIGEGDVPWDDVFELCETIGGTQWYIVEQETYAHPPLECVAMCIENLRKMGKV